MVTIFVEGTAIFCMDEPKTSSTSTQMAEKKNSSLQYFFFRQNSHEFYSPDRTDRMLWNFFGRRLPKNALGDDELIGVAAELGSVDDGCCCCGIFTLFTAPFLPNPNRMDLFFFCV